LCFAKHNYIITFLSSAVPKVARQKSAICRDAACGQLFCPFFGFLPARAAKTA
jgi:hypothetical protein